MNCTYEEAERSIQVIGDYTLSPLRKDEFTLKHRNVEGHEGLTRGWKIHISIDDSDEENIKRALFLVVPLLMGNNIALAKFLKAHWKDESHGPWEYGRHITLYYEPQHLVQDLSVLNWNELVANIAKVLQEAGIQPGNLNAVCRPFPESEYASYRHDLYHGEYIGCREVYNENNIKIKYKPSADVIDIFNPEPLELEAEADDSCCNRCVIF